METDPHWHPETSDNNPTKQDTHRCVHEHVTVHTFSQTTPSSFDMRPHVMCVSVHVFCTAAHPSSHAASERQETDLRYSAPHTPDVRIHRTRFVIAAVHAPPVDRPEG